MKLIRTILLIIFILKISIGASAQIPRNVDSIKMKYDSALSNANRNRAKMVFSIEIDQRKIKRGDNYYGYVDQNGSRAKFLPNRKNEVLQLPTFKTDSVRLFYSDNKTTISGGYVSRSILEQGCAVYFGILDNLHKHLDRFDRNEEYRTDMSNHHRGLFAVLSNARVRNAADNIKPSFKLHYCVIQYGESQMVSFHILGH